MKLETRSLPGRVYLITNTINGKRYVGFTSQSVGVRWKAHCKGGPDSARLLHRAVIEFGPQSFTIEIVFEGSREEALQTEERLIRELGTYGNGYNGSTGGEAPYLGRRTPPEIRAKLSASLKGNKFSLGYKHTAESKARMSAAHMGNPSNTGRRLSPGHCLKISLGNKGKKRSEEVRLQMSLRSKGRGLGRKLTEEHRAKIGAASKGNTYSLGHKHSAETRAKMSTDPRRRDRMIGNTIFLGRTHSEETKAKMRQSALDREARKRALRQC